MQITAHLKASEVFSQLTQMIRAGQVPCSLFGVPESLKPHLASALSQQLERSVIVVCADEGSAEMYADALETAVYIPHRPLQLRSSVARSREVMFRRIDGISKMQLGEANIAFLSEEALLARLVSPDDFEFAHLTIRKDAVYDPEKLIQILVLNGYERVGSVETAGQAARRGEILDVFCPGAVAPYRIDFFDTVVESIHAFDPGTQRRSRESLNEVTIPPAVELVLSEDAADKNAEYFSSIKPKNPVLAQRFEDYAQHLNKHHYFDDLENYAYLFGDNCLLDYVPDALVLFDDHRRVTDAEQQRSDEFRERLDTLLQTGTALADQQTLYLSLPHITASGKDIVDLCTISESADLHSKATLRLKAKSALSYHRKLELLKDDLKGRVAAGWRVYLACGSLARAERLASELSDASFSVPCIKDHRMLEPGEAGTYPDRLLSGFELTTQEAYFLGEHEIYGFARKHRRTASRKRMDIFTDLKPGDIIVHDIHGKGRFLGLVTRAVQGISRDYMELEYRDGDKLFIPTDQIDRVQKYMGGENERLSKLGGREWNQAKARVKKAVKELAEDLVSIYSERIHKKGHKYSEDTLWQHQFEDSFPYDETEGQLQSIDEIKKDMQQEKVMDRLLLGDVGYGKTEVAMRACFKAVMEGRQCAVLVPTTLLARQHSHTFRERFKEFAVSIESVSRYVSAADQTRIMNGLKAGTVDIVIGTHRLLSPDIKFKDLGLLVIDEEQRFGVSHKERIKDIKRSVDVLTLSATPIPRTLQMALTGIRDMSVLDTPPEERKAPESYVMEYSGQLLRDAVTREMDRGGQAYLVCRQIGLMDHLVSELRKNVPEARVAVAHGRMGETQMEDTMEDFLNGMYDVLLCTTIIESGIDIPNVNTVIVYEADKFGLAQLYQIKGRVGRAANTSYAYLTYLPGTHMTPEAEKRLATIAEFTELGAGFKIAMRDLEIRGAGNLLGAEQSGQMAAVGYDMYCRLMREAVAEIKGEHIERPADTSVEIGLNAHIPASYIDDEIQRIDVYKKIAAIEGTRSAKELKEEIVDRYGKMPKSVQNLILISLIKRFAARAGIVSVTRNASAFTLKYPEGCTIDTDRLLVVLHKHKNTRLRDAVPPYITFKAPKTAIEALLQFLNDIRHCCTAKAEG